MLSVPGAFLVRSFLILFQISAGVKKIVVVCYCSLKVVNVSLTRYSSGLDVVPTGVLNCSSIAQANIFAFFPSL